ncbi:MAG: hypothetical protein NC923_00795 [Candidatus Omnitrophica bacterium]|nr:hypothetical protein [Candidatus Omnitrophota bacterium]
MYAPTQIPIIIKTLVYRFLLFLLVCFLLWFRLVPAARLNTFIGFLVVSSLASSTGMTISQGLAPYHIGFNYGEDGMQELVQYLHRKVKKGDIIVATDDISHRLGLSSKAYLDYSIWHDTEAMRRYLQEPKVSALVISITANTIEQLRAIRQDSKLAEILQNHFEYRHIGTYRVWTKIKTVAASARQLCPRMQTLAYKNCFTQRR